MLNKESSKQKSGNNSVNMQQIESENVNISMNGGITYSDAKEIAQDVFNSNFYKLSEQAGQIAQKRANEFIDLFLSQLSKRNPKSMSSMNNPNMQYALFTAQKEYARTGDKALSETLVDVLVDLAKENNRTLKQIVLEESLSIISKLTTEQLDVLSFIFILRYSKNYGINNFETLNKYINKYLRPFVSKLTKENSCYQHLEFCGCGTIQISEVNIETVFQKSYSGIFFKGLSKEKLNSTLESKSFQTLLNSRLITKSLHDKKLFQINAIDYENFRKTAKKLEFSDNEINKLINLQKSNCMNEEEIKDFLIELNETMKIIFDYWDNSPLKNMTLTSVGIAIAQANIRRKTNIVFDLDIWIK